MWDMLTKLIDSYELVFWWLGILSFVALFVSISVIPFIIIRIPANYFNHNKRHSLPWSGQHPLAQLLLLFARNILGLILITIGFILLFLPGQGILTILVGVLLLNFPGKFRFERWLISQPAILKSVNWLRLRNNKTAIIIN